MPGSEERLAARPGLDRLLADEVQDHREVVRAERPERVLVAPDLPEVLAVAVEVEHVPEVAVGDQLLEHRDGRVVEQEIAGHQHEAALLRDRHELLRLGARLRLGLLDEDVLACEQRPLRELVVRDDGRRDHDRVQLRVGEHLVEARRRPGLRMAGRGLREQVGRQVAEPAEVGELGEVAGEVRAPVAEARVAHAHRRHSFQTFPFDVPFEPGRVPEVDDERRLLDELVVVDPRVRRDDDDAVDARRVERGRREPVLGQLADVRIVVRDVGALALQELDQLQRRRLARVVDVRLVGDAEDLHLRALERLLLGVQRPRDLAQAPPRHVLVDLARELDELRVEVVLPRLPRQVERVDRHAVAAQARARLEAHEAEGLRRRGAHDLPDVDVHPVTELGELVDERDVHRPEDVLEELRQLGRLGRRDRVHRVDGAARRAPPPARCRPA